MELEKLWNNKIIRLAFEILGFTFIVIYSEFILT